MRMFRVHKVAGRRYLLLAVAAAVLCASVIGVLAFRAYRAPAPRLMSLADGTEIFYLSDALIAPSNAYPARDGHADRSPICKRGSNISRPPNSRESIVSWATCT